MEKPANRLKLGERLNGLAGLGKDTEDVEPNLIRVC